MSGPSSPVHSWNEWDPLEEVIVGTAWGARMPSSRDPIFDDGAGNAGMGAMPMPQELIMRVQQQLDDFVARLQAEGVRVRRPTPFDLTAAIATPHFQVPCGFNFMNARDLVLIVGDQIIECPTASRSRQCEVLAYRPLFKEYFGGGARWVSAPRPELSERSFYGPEARAAQQGPAQVAAEFEPLFDAADFVRCGTDLFYQRGAGTNRFGIEWLRRHLGEPFRLHEVGTRCPTPVHLDTTFVPLAPGRALINPHWIGQLPAVAADWELIEAPNPQGSTSYYQGVQWQTSAYIGMNVFSLDEKRLFVDAQQVDLIALLRRRGFVPIPLPFDLPPFLGGAFHCVTLDVRRRGNVPLLDGNKNR